MPWWEPANADALDGAAACDPAHPQLEATPAHKPVVHKQAVYVPIMHAATTDALDATAAVDAVQLDANPAQQVVVQKEAALAADSSKATQVSHTDWSKYT